MLATDVCTGIIKRFLRIGHAMVLGEYTVELQKCHASVKTEVRASVIKEHTRTTAYVSLDIPANTVKDTVVSISHINYL